MTWKFYAIRTMTVLSLIVAIQSNSLSAASIPNLQVDLNNFSSPIAVLDRDTVSLGLSLETGDFSGANADWWLVRLFDNGQASFNPINGKFESGLKPSVQNALTDISLNSFLNISHEQSGQYQYCFAVDTVMNGEPDWEKLYYDCAMLNIVEHNTLIRDFTLPTPLFSAQSAWRQRVAEAEVLSNSEDIINYNYQILNGDTSSLVNGDVVNWPYIVLNYDDYTVPIFKASAENSGVILCDYDGNLEWPSSKYQGEFELGDPIDIPHPSGMVRPAGPQSTSADGWLVLFNPDSGMAYDFWQASTSREGQCKSHGGAYLGDKVIEAGYTDFFDTASDGANQAGLASARAVGTPLLAGLILPEDIAGGVIAHTLAFAIPGPRNLAVDPFEPDVSDYAYPASTTETDFYSTDVNAMIAGQRIRLKQTIVDSDGELIDESVFSPVTQMFLKALREYGAIMVDNAGGFVFYAEDIHTGRLSISDEEVNRLIGQPEQQALATNKTRWQVVVETLQQELEVIPIAYASGNNGDSSSNVKITISNFQVVSGATKP